MWIKCQQCGGFGWYKSTAYTRSGRLKRYVTVCPFCRGTGSYEFKESKDDKMTERREAEHETD